MSEAVDEESIEEEEEENSESIIEYKVESPELLEIMLNSFDILERATQREISINEAKSMYDESVGVKMAELSSSSIKKTRKSKKGSQKSKKKSSSIKAKSKKGSQKSKSSQKKRKKKEVNKDNVESKE
ncbi:MAG: hypothetical protein ACP5I6_02620 [Caldisphaera sp.]|jgi:hypothetical protein|nr:MAG: hypothetical protein C0201_03005 [Caldisphaera sp.]PMP88236.1 MAG: hypothetical protein C0172_03105 [Caldisphaera sp.]